MVYYISKTQCGAKEAKIMWIFFALCCLLGWLYWKFLKFFLGPMAKAIDDRLIAFVEDRTGVRPDMAKAIVRLSEIGLIVGVALLATIH